ncbi:hypothetical protein ACFE04_015925 [Oxalis oulophora]
MVSDIRKSKNEGSANSPSKGDSSSKGSISSEPSGLRRSGRETSSQNNVISSPQTSRKSDRLEKQMPPTTPPTKRKSDKLDKQDTPSPLRRSERGKKQPASSPAGSKISDRSSSSSGAKVKKDKHVDVSTPNPQRNKKVEQPPVVLEKNTRHARAYREDLKRQLRKAESAVHGQILNGTFSVSFRPSQDDDTDWAKKVDSISHSSEEAHNLDEEDHVERSNGKAVVEPSRTACKFPKESSTENELSISHVQGVCTDIDSALKNVDALEAFKSGVVSTELREADMMVLMDDSALELSISHVQGVCTDIDSAPKDVDALEAFKSGVVSTELHEADKMVPMDDSALENVQAVDLVGSSLDDKAINSGSEKIMPSDSPVHSSKSVGKREIQIQTSDTCFKRQRIDQDLLDLLQPDLCSSKTTADQNLSDTLTLTDRGDLEPTGVAAVPEKNSTYMQQDSPSIDISESCQKLCVTCKMGGELLYCGGRGCKRSYHLSCFDPPFEDVPLGVLHCRLCVTKKMESGILSVSDGVELICSTREVEDLEVELNDKGLEREKKEKQYLVKYQGLAHIHNRWIPEKELLAEAPLVVASFNHNSQGVCWKEEWTVPDRLLQKRIVQSKKSRAEDKVDCLNEWLVKWCGLGYEHATWELDTASIFKRPEVQNLIHEYETRHRKAKEPAINEADIKCPEGQNLIVDCESRQGKAKEPVLIESDIFKCPEAQNHINDYEPRHGKAKEVAVIEFDKAQEIRKGSSGLENDFVNKLRKYRDKGQNVTVFDNQERIMKLISYISSSLHNVSRPFLIISTSDAIQSWDHEIVQLAPALDVVIYKGSKEDRNKIRAMDFYEEGDSLMFQVLLTLPEVILEDLNVFEVIEWGSIIIDECQCISISSIFEELKMLKAEMKILLFCGQPKESVSEYHKILSLLDPSGDDSNSIAYLKEKLMKYTAYDCKSDCSKFVEYWVPAELSNVQLEQYCANLLANSLCLRSSFRSDHVGALRDVLTSIRKCCDHPYVEDKSLGSYLVKDLDASEYLRVGIKASGKLQILDTMLQEIKKQGLRVLILFQSIGSYGRDRLVSILDDYLRQRFGQESYECVDGVLSPQKKQAALNKFNNENSGSFVFLLETRACLPSIKLSSVSHVIIYDSDWCPMTDMRSLQKIKLDSKLEQIKVFRLYSSSTVEERALILAKRSQNISRSLDSSNLNRIASHMLLMWGAPLLFNRLYAFHHQNKPASITCEEQLLLKAVHQEFLTILSGNGQDSDANKSSKILKVKQCHGAYTSEPPLVCEAKLQVIDEEPPHIFWTKLLDGRNPEWKYSSVSSPRNRKRTQHDAPLKRLEGESEEVVKKRKKSTAHDVNQSSVTPPACDVSHFLNDSNPWVIAEQVSIPMPHTNITSESLAASKDRRKLLDSQQSLHLSLKPEIEKLCHVLKLSEDVTNTAKEFLEYIMNNHLVDREPEKMLHAFQLSLCWTAASLRKYKVCHKTSHARVQDVLNFGCSKAEAEYANSKLRCLKKLYLHSTGKLKEPSSPKPSELSNDQSNNVCSQAATDLQKFNEDVENSPYDIKQFLSEMMSAPGFHHVQNDFLKSISYITKKCKKQVSKFLGNYDEENKKVEKAYGEEMEKLENWKKTETSMIRLQFKGNISMRAQKLKILDNEYEKKFEDLKRERDTDVERSKAQHLATMNTVRENEAAWVEGMKSWAKLELANLVLDNNNKGATMQDSETNFIVCGLRSSKVHESSGEFVDTPISPTSPHVENQSLDDVVLEAGDGQNISCDEQIHVGEVISPASPHVENQSLDDVVLEAGDGQNISCDEQIHVGEVISQVDTDNSAQCTKGAIGHLSDNGGQEKNVEDASNTHDRGCPSSIPENGGSREHICDGITVHVSDPKVLSVTPSCGNGISVNPPVSGVEAVPESTTSNKDSSGLHDMVSDNHVQDGSQVEVDSALAAANKEIGGSYAGASDNLVEDMPHVEDSVPSQGRNAETSSLADSQPSTNLPQVGQLVSSQVFPVVSSSIPCTPTSVLAELGVPSSEKQADQVVRHPFVVQQLPGIISASGTGSQSIREEHIPSQVTETPVQVDQVRGFPVMESAPQVRETRTAPSTSGSGFQERAAALLASLMPPPAISQDPLQNELDRIRKETERTIKFHEESKIQLLSDRDKELQDAITQIHAKYNSKIKEIENEFKMKKDQLDTIHKRVALNKMLAEAFRSKCTQPPALQQDMNPILTQQLAQQSSHQRISPASGLHNSTFPAPTRPSTPLAVPNRPNTPFPTTNLQNRPHLRPNTSTPVPNVHNTPVPVPVLPKTSLPLAPNLRKTPPVRTPILRNMTPMRAPNLRNTPPVPGSNLQHVSAPTISPSLRSNVPGSAARPPQISSISSAVGNVQTGFETRAPAPHMAAYRPSTSSISGSPGQNTPSLSQLKSQLPGLVYQSVSNFSRASTEVLRAVDNMSNPATNLPHVQNIGPLLQSNPGQQTTKSVEVVCISDDED